MFHDAIFNVTFLTLPHALVDISMSFVLERGCASDGGFQLHGTYIDSGSGHADDARLLLFLKTDGFRTGTLSSGHGTITFEFEVDCAGSCYLKFNQVTTVPSYCSAVQQMCVLKKPDRTIFSKH